MTETAEAPRDTRLRVLIAGGGIAALETAFALRALAGDRVAMSLLAPTTEFIDRPRVIGEPTEDGQAQHYPLASLLAQAEVELVAGALTEVDPQRKLIRTSEDEICAYDELVIATGAATLPRFSRATTLEPAALDGLTQRLAGPIERGSLHHLSIVVPAPAAWPLPAYELALMVSERAWDVRRDLEIVIVTPERQPLEIFGEPASEKLAARLDEHGVTVITSAVADVPSDHIVITHPGGQVIETDRIIALPETRGTRIPGLPADGGGFLPVDRFGRVRATRHVWAVGDVTDFPVKQAGVAAALADVIADGIAARAGVRSTARPFAPALHATLLTGGEPLYLYGRPSWPSAHGESELSDRPIDRADDQPRARHLGPQLRRLRAVGAPA